MAGTREQHAAGDPRLDPTPHLPELSKGKAAGVTSSRSTPGHAGMLKLHLQAARARLSPFHPWLHPSGLMPQTNVHGCA